MTDGAEPVVERGSSNVFRDLGFRDPDTHLLKARLVSRLADLIAARGLTQAQAARVLGVGQPDVSRLLRGHFRDDAVVRLLGFLTAFDQDVTIEVRPKPAERARARLTVAESE